ncbi:Conidiation-specific protein [Penicillium ucsense]|uniref:Conidiation-specific protein n=1 Tax=Penicillium ucsense TaxID=2839758 RepID=A0A8J8WKS1_9EURO|nr:Conidiation-specific protein [Penicillium ucsense]KAF7738410.1 Conidiation-specific protein [Penicillium ucsense]
MTDNTNPGNFANRSKEEVREIASKGGQSSHQGGFASMDADKQRDIASKGGQASSGSFHPGDPRAKEAGQKGGQAS